MGLEKGKKKRISHCHFEKIAFYKKPDTILLVHFYLMKSGPDHLYSCLLYTSPSPRDLSTSRMPSSA